jgi:hypothetical protein
MKMVRHKTEPVYRRYAIASDADLREAAVKLAVVSELSKAPTGIMTNSVNGGGRSLSTTWTWPAPTHGAPAVVSRGPAGP